MSEVIKITDILHGKKHANKLKFMPPANNTTGKQIREICDDTREQLLERIKKKAPHSQLNLTTQPTLQILDNLLRIMRMKTYSFASHWKEELQVKTFLQN
jgi:hypothetical protein